MNAQRPVFNPDEIVLLRTILDEVAALLPAKKRTSETKTLMAHRILVCAAKGERDPVRLRTAAILECKTGGLSADRDQFHDTLEGSWWGG